MRSPRPLVQFNLSFTIATLFACAGCQTVNTELAMLFGDPVPAQPPAAANETPSDLPKFLVELRESGRKPELVQIPLPDVMYVQQALEQTGAIRRFRRMKIQLFRHLPEGGGHRLDIAFDRTSRKVPAGADYALHANDRLVVTEDTSTVLDDMLGGISAPLSKAVGRVQ